MSEPGTGNEQPTELVDSNPNASGPERAAGGMGVSSERVGDVSGGATGTDGERDTRVAGTGGAPEADADGPPEQSTGGEEPQPDGIEPKAGYPSPDPRSDDAPYKDA